MYDKIFLKQNGADTCTYLMTYTAPRRIQGGMMGLRRVRPRDPNPQECFIMSLIVFISERQKMLDFSEQIGLANPLPTETFSGLEPPLLNHCMPKNGQG